MYYLNSRYYNPELGCYISAKDVNDITPSSINGANLYTYSVNNPITVSARIEKVAQVYGHSIANNVVSNGGSLFGHVNSISYTTEIWNFNFLAMLNVTYDQKISQANRNKPLFYSFNDQNMSTHNKATTSMGVGMNALNWLGAEVCFSIGFNGWDFIFTGKESPFDINASVQITPWFNINTSIGLGGLSLGVSISSEGVSHDFTLHVTPIPVVVLVYFGIMAPNPGQSLVPAV